MMRVVSEKALIAWREELRAEKQKVVLTNGCFDLVHVGHLQSLEYAASLGDHLVVAVNGDASVKSLKGPNRPICSQDDRASLLAGFRCVSRVVIFHETRLDRLITFLKPDLYVKGGDYTVETLDLGERRALEQVGSQIEFFPTVEGQSTTSMLKKLRSSEEKKD